MTIRKITALKLQRRNPDRVNVFLDGEFAFGLAKIVAGWLKIDQELSEEKIADLLAKDEIEVALIKAFNFLSYRPRTEKEVRDRMAKKGFEEYVIDEIIRRLSEHNYINDSDFADMWVENRSAFRPRGQRALRMELRRKGVADDVIQQATDNLDEKELAFRAAQKQARSYRNLEWADFRKKMYGFLARRGFNYDHINQVTLQAWEQLERPPTEIEDETE